MGNAYNPGERYLAKFLSKFPQIKAAIKKGYQTFNFLLYKKAYSYKSVNPLHMVASGAETFFGYYDKSPISAGNQYILYNTTNHSTKKLPDASKPIDICVFDFEQNKIIHTFSASSYNWQQGARAQWLNFSSFIFNNYSSELGYHSVIVDLKENKTRTLSQPVYDCYKDEYALSLNFTRLMALRPDYGYRNKAIVSNKDIEGLNEDGIFKIDIQTGETKLLISLHQLRQENSVQEMSYAQHKVNHIMISPNGKNFIFLHRYYINRQRFDRLFVADSNGSNIKLLADDEMVSHFCWMDNDNIIAYLRDKKLGDKYYRVNIQSGAKVIVGEGIIDKFGDGHPSVYRNKMVFDTYPNKARMKELFLLDLESNKLDKLGEFYEGLQYSGQSRCDLHPRFSYDGEKVFFDSVHNGSRSLYWMEI
jgi:hypothetical protein